MRRIQYIRLLFLCGQILVAGVVYGQTAGYLKGSILLGEEWEQIVYLSHIPSFEDMYTMSQDMIISSAPIDSSGSFTIDLSFLPDHASLFRLHLVKKGDTPTSLIIGGKDENHLFLLASGSSQIRLLAGSANPPFSSVTFENSISNTNFQQVTDLVYRRTGIAAESDAAKRRFIENDLRAQLGVIADTTDDHLLALYALYKRDGEIDHAADPELYTALVQKWEGESSPYLQEFRDKIPESPNRNHTPWLIAGGLLLLVIGFLLGRRRSIANPEGPDISKLSIQERKIFELLRKGASNQEISEECNIGVSTVKSHVSSIYTKLKIRSRKEVMNLPQVN